MEDLFVVSVAIGYQPLFANARRGHANPPMFLDERWDGYPFVGLGVAKRIQ
jgi:hypothetical protein